ncbi:hypothetical protein [uncultured Roseibium sp.]|uniref:capsular polysaccharide export protein, LipB/KpsS family n=1 Tax=uncultured Roseibium sp. TaxID=1936171 RepID=UPI00263536BC|nr:hypothetical protein [uncultured Roseibium sp.]
MEIGVFSTGLWKLRNRLNTLTDSKIKRLGFFSSRADVIAGWGHKNTATEARNAAIAHAIPYVAVEDGFLRSINPGSKEPPFSMIIDRTGVYYDARQPSDLEAFIRRRAQIEDLHQETRKAMAFLRDNRLSKYNNSTLHDISELPEISTSRNECVLVVDQTAGDASITGGLATDHSFSSMLASALSENPKSQILLRVHPESMSGAKPGHFSEGQLRQLAATNNDIAKALNSRRIRLTPEPINPWLLLENCSKTYCISSQLGFEALIAGCEVHCFGVPFYAGWGLTKDRGADVPRRRTQASLEDVFAGTYFDYCRYISEDGLRILDFWQTALLLRKKSTNAFR